MKYVGKPIQVDAMLLTEGLRINEMPSWCIEAFKKGIMHEHRNGSDVFIETNRGVLKAQNGDYIIKGVEGVIYPCKASIFEASFECMEV